MDGTKEGMDTRRKIVKPGNQWSVPAAAMVAVGYFDPLLSQHAAQLEELKRTAECLVVVVLDPEDPILEMDARAELVASLACVDYVMTEERGTPAGRVDMTGEHRQWRDEFLMRVKPRIK